MAGLTEAIHAAIDGPERRDIDIRDHGFNVKPVDKQTINNEFHIWGQISHKLRWRPDDQVYYHILKIDGVIQKIDRDINRGGWGRIIGPAATIVGPFIGVPIPPGSVEAIADQLGQIAPDGWEQAADIIIAAVAIEVK